jgi:hypothetical protein
MHQIYLKYFQLTKEKNKLETLGFRITSVERDLTTRYVGILFCRGQNEKDKKKECCLDPWNGPLFNFTRILYFFILRYILPILGNFRMPIQLSAFLIKLERERRKERYVNSFGQGCNLTMAGIFYRRFVQN